MSTATTYINQLWPEAQWDVSGAFAFDRELLHYSDFCADKLQIPKVFGMVHGSPLCTWNSGRVLPHLQGTAPSIQAAIKGYADRHIALLLTFSNQLLAKEELKQHLGNILCQAAEENNPTGQNAIILSADVLNEHIKTSYPKLKRISSILKITCEHGAGKLDLYQRYLDEYDHVMVHPDDVIKPSFLEQLPDKDRCIIIINEYCMRNCPIRHLHYKSLSESSLNYIGADDRKFQKLMMKNGCSNIPGMLSDEKINVLALSDPELQRLYDMGFRHFKIQGRGIANAVTLISNLMHFSLRKDAPDETQMQRLRQHYWETITPYKTSI